jgi:CHAT domain-containing protein
MPMQLMQRCTARLQALYDQLWRPLQPLLVAVDEAVVVPCQALQALPFPALHDGAQWLDERVRITLSPAAALAPMAPLPAAPRRALVVGDGRGWPTCGMRSTPWPASCRPTAC